MQPLAAGVPLTAYHSRLQLSHDFRIYVDVLDLNEALIGSATFLDGQVNIESPQENGVRRTASLTLLDVDGALDFSGASAWSGTSLWVDRLVRVRHQVVVPGRGTFTAVPFIGPPTSLSRSGAQVTAALSDKAALANRGSRAFTVAKGMLATEAIEKMMRYCTGEFRFRLTPSRRRLSRSYSAGLADESAPMVVAMQIASAELGMQLLYSCDGFLMLRPTPTKSVINLGQVTEPAQSSVDFSTIVNYVRVSGAVKSTSVTKKNVTTTKTSQPVSAVQVQRTHPMSPQRLQRKGVPRLLPLLIEESGYTNTKQTAARAARELSRKSSVTSELTASVIPVFHLDADDVVTVQTDIGETTTLRLTQGSIPLGVGGDMTIGTLRRVATRVTRRPRSRVIRTRTRKRRPPRKKAPKKTTQPKKGKK